MADKAATYTELALWAISIAQGPASSLRQWWADERAHREDYGLSQGQIDKLVEACRLKVESWGSEESPRSEPKPRSTNQRARQGSLI